MLSFPYISISSTPIFKYAEKVFKLGSEWIQQILTLDFKLEELGKNEIYLKKNWQICPI